MTGSPRALYIVKRLIMVPVGTFIVITVTFFLINAVPSDPVGARLGDLATPDAVLAEKVRLGLDQDIVTRYFHMIAGVFHGDLGTDYYTGTSITVDLFSRMTSTLLLAVPAVLLAFVIGVSLGSLEASFIRTRWIRLIVTGLQAIPSFVLAVLGILLLVVTFPLLPSPNGQVDQDIEGQATHTGSALVDGLINGRFDIVSNTLGHTVLPVLAIALVGAVPFARITNSAMRNALVSDFSSFGTGNGLARFRVVINALRSSRSSIVTITGIVAAELLGSTVIVERIFSWNGLGQWALDSITKKDLPAVQGFVIFSAVATLVIYLVSDIVALLLDPRVEA